MAQPQIRIDISLSDSEEEQKEDSVAPLLLKNDLTSASNRLDKTIFASQLYKHCFHPFFDTASRASLKSVNRHLRDVEEPVFHQGQCRELATYVEKIKIQKLEYLRNIENYLSHVLDLDLDHKKSIMENLRINEKSAYALMHMKGKWDSSPDCKKWNKCRPRMRTIFAKGAGTMFYGMALLFLMMVVFKPVDTEENNVFWQRLCGVATLFSVALLAYAAYNEPKLLKGFESLLNKLYLCNRKLKEADIVLIKHPIIKNALIAKP